MYLGGHFPINTHQHTKILTVVRVSTSIVAQLQQGIQLPRSKLEDNKARHHPLYMDHYCREIEKEHRLDQILAEENPLDCVYAYWIVDGKRITPAIISNYGAYSGFLEDLRDEFGAYEYEIMIRRGRTMVFTGRISFAKPINFIPAKDIRTEITRLRNKKRKRSQN